MLKIYAQALLAHLCNACIVDHLSAFFYETRFENNVPFNNSTPMYLINLHRKLGLSLGLDLKLHYFSIFHGE